MQMYFKVHLYVTIALRLHHCHYKIKTNICHYLHVNSYENTYLSRSTDTLLSNDSLLSPSGNGVSQTANNQSEPAGTANKEQETNKSVLVDLPENGGEPSTHLPKSNGSDYVRDFPQGEVVHNPEQTVTELPGTVPLTSENASESINAATTSVDSSISCNELTSPRVDPSTVKNDHLTDAKVDPRRAAQKFSNHLNEQSYSFDEDRAKNNRNKKLNQLLGEKAFQSFEEMNTRGRN